MKNKHTPGPWRASERGGYSDFDGDSRVIIGDDMRIAVVHDSGSSECSANTCLIVSAPDLLAAAQDAVKSLNWVLSAYPDISLRSTFAENVRELGSAIAKAKGS